jgi:Domain of unknown function (DUF4389)
MTTPYAARLEVDYPERLDRVSTFFRILFVIPIAIVYSLLSATATYTSYVVRDGEVIGEVTRTTGGIAGGLFAATAVMIVVRQRYPRWWFDFLLGFNRFGARIGAYVGLLTDQYPSTEDEQSVHLDLDYPDARDGLNRWLPLVKWLLALPHYFVLAFLYLGAIGAWVIAWFAILFTGRYPQSLFDYTVGVVRWTLRVLAYTTFLLTDDYPPFSLRP